MSKRVSVPLNPSLQEYIKTALTDSIYKELRSITSKPIEDYAQVTIQVEIQDVYLGNSNIPSRRGKLVKDDWNKYPYLALDLGMLRKGTYSPLVRGQNFLSLVSEDEKKAFGSIYILPVSPNSNPFRLTVTQKLLLLFSFVENDGDVLKALYKNIIGIDEPFGAAEPGDYLPEIYRMIVKQSRPRARSGDDLLRIQKLLDTADKIKAWKSKPYKGGGARDHAIVVRLEPFVDLGLLSKPDPFAYRYQITDVTRIFFESLISLESIDHFLRHSFFDVSNKAYGLNGKHRTDRDASLPAIQKAYTVLKSPLGYAPILEVALLAGIYSITESRTYFEISESIDTLKSLQKERPELVRFNVDRWGALTFVKFNSDIMKVVRG